MTFGVGIRHTKYEIIRQWYAKLYLTIVDTVQYGN